MAHKITGDCVACGACEPECSARAITESAVKYRIDSKKCSDCGACIQICPMEAIAAGPQG